MNDKFVNLRWKDRVGINDKWMNNHAGEKKLK